MPTSRCVSLGVKRPSLAQTRSHGGLRSGIETKQGEIGEGSAAGPFCPLGELPALALVLQVVADEGLKVPGEEKVLFPPPLLLLMLLVGDGVLL